MINDSNNGLLILTQGIITGDSYTFDFKNKISAFVYGISGFSLGYDDTEYDVKKIYQQVNLGNVDREQGKITISVSADIEDGDGGSGKDNYCWAYVTILAWVGIENDALFVQNTDLIENGKSGQIYDLGDTSKASASFISGFQYTANASAYVKKINGAIGMIPGLRNTQIGAKSTGSITTDEPPNTCSLSAGLLATLDSASGVYIKTVSIDKDDMDVGRKNIDKEVDFGVGLQQATAFLQSFSMELDEDRKIACIKAGAMAYDGGTTDTNYKVWVEDTKAKLKVNMGMWRYGHISGHHASNVHKATFVVIGVAKGAAPTPPPISINSMKTVTVDW